MNSEDLFDWMLSLLMVEVFVIANIGIIVIILHAIGIL